MRSMLLLAVATLALASPHAALSAPSGEGLRVASAPDHPEPGTDRCGGVAPDETWCTTGAHVRVGVSVSNECGPIYWPYTGTVESLLVHPAGVHRLTCDFVDGRFVDASVTGIFPPEGAPYVHVCRSLDTATGAMGGEGQWQCGTGHGGL